MKRFLIVFLLAGIAFSHAGELKVWEYRSPRDLMADRMIFYAAGGCALEKKIAMKTAPSGEAALELQLKRIAPGAPRHAIQVNFLSREKLEAGKNYRIQFTYKGDRNGEIQIAPAQASAPFALLAGNVAPVLSVSREWQTCTLDFRMESVPAGTHALPRMMIASFPEGGTLWIGPVTLSETPRHLPLSLSPRWTLKEPEGKTRTVTLGNHSFSILRNGKNPPEKMEFEFVNEFDSGEDGFMQLGMSADWWFTASVNGERVYSTEPHGNQSDLFRPEDHIFNLPVRKGKNVLSVVVRAGSAGCRFVCGPVKYVADPEAAHRLFKVTESERYRPLPNDRYLVRKGTALDFSDLTGKRLPAGTLGRVIVNSAGKLAFEKKPDQPVRFIGMNFSPGFWRLEGHKWTKTDIERFADGLAAQGYNLIRVHYLCRYLIGFKIHSRPHRTIAEAGLPQTAAEIPFDPGNLDRFDYLVKCFKERGIYLNVDLMNTPGYSMAYAEGAEEAFKTDLLFSPQYRTHWKAAVHFLMNRVNPYTKTKLKDEPAIAFVNFFNEQDFILSRRKEMKKFEIPFRNALKRKYQTEAALSRAWGKKVSFESAGRIDETVLREGGAAARDTGEFLIATMREMSSWYFRTLREAGYPGLFHHWDMIMRTMEIPARSLMPAIAQHTYFAHPNSLPTRNLAPKCRGAVFLGGRDMDMTVEQGSSLNSSYFRSAAAARFLDRPFMITEHSHSSFNRYRHERGLYFGSYAALQGWDNLTPHGDNIRLTVDPMWLFEHGMDPISRASEVVSALVFLRGDVKEAPHSVGLLLKNANLFPKNCLSAINDDYGKLSMLTKIGILYPEGKALLPVGACRPDLLLEPKQFSPLRVTTWYVSADNSDGSSFPCLLSLLKRRNILPADNPTDWSRRIYQSETGELTLDTQKLTLSVVTPRLEGAILKLGANADLPLLRVRNLTVPASVVAASLHANENLRNASRVLLVVATNAFNTNMTFENASMFCCVNPGDLPVLMETVRGTIELTTTQKQAPKVYALHLDGTRFAELPCELKNGILNLPLDTSRLKNGTPFFEISYKN